MRMLVSMVGGVNSTILIHVDSYLYSGMSNDQRSKRSEATAAPRVHNKNNGL